MFEKLIATTGSLIHSAFIPVVHAESNDVQRLDEETVWDRMKAVVHIK